MNKGVLFALTAVSFGGIGGLVGFLIARKKFFDLADREVESMKARQAEHDEWLLGLYGIKPEDRKPTEPAPKPSTATVTPNTVRPSADRLEQEKAIKEGQAAFVDYSKIAKNYSEPEGGSQGGNNAVANGDIYVITPDEFNESDYSYQTLYYYPDGHISDSDGNLLPNFVELVGNVNLWGGYFDNLNAVYVRNDRTGTDYEILKVNKAWKDTASPAQKAASLNVNGNNEDDD